MWNNTTKEIFVWKLHSEEKPYTNILSTCFMDCTVSLETVRMDVVLVGYINPQEQLHFHVLLSLIVEWAEICHMESFRVIHHHQERRNDQPRIPDIILFFLFLSESISTTPVRIVVVDTMVVTRLRNDVIDVWWRHQQPIFKKTIKSNLQCILGQNDDYSDQSE